MWSTNLAQPTNRCNGVASFMCSGQRCWHDGARHRLSVCWNTIKAVREHPKWWWRKWRVQGTAILCNAGALILQSQAGIWTQVFIRSYVGSMFRWLYIRNSIASCQTWADRLLIARFLHVGYWRIGLPLRCFIIYGSRWENSPSLTALFSQLSDCSGYFITGGKRVIYQGALTTTTWPVKRLARQNY